jgi:hypothetical protein
MWTTGSRAWERELVAECEAFFSGQYAQYLDNENRPIPVWAWLNVLAHGSEDDITALAAGEPPRRTFPETAVWHQALAFLAQELMSQAARRGRPVADLQCSTLVPLELELAGRRAPSSVEPAMFVSSVLSALAQHPTGRHP